MKTKSLLAIVIIFCFALNSLAEEPVAKISLQITVKVNGAVKNSSRFTLPSGASILDALAAAGDANKDANLQQVWVIRKMAADEPIIIKVDLTEVREGKAPNVVLQDNDIVFVPMGRGPGKY